MLRVSITSTTTVLLSFPVIRSLVLTRPLISSSLRSCTTIGVFHHGTILQQQQIQHAATSYFLTARTSTTQMTITRSYRNDKGGGYDRGGGGGGGGARNRKYDDDAVDNNNDSYRNNKKTTPHKKGNNNKNNNPKRNQPNHYSNNNNNSNSSSSNNNNKKFDSKVSVYTVWSTDSDDVRNTQDLEEPDMVNLPKQHNNNKHKTLQEFLQAYADVSDVDTDDGVHIYNSQTKQFEELVTLQQVMTEKSRNNGKVFLSPNYEEDDDYYNDDVEDNDDDDDDDDDDDEFDYDYDPYGDDSMEMINIIHNLATKLETDGWSRIHDTQHGQQDQIPLYMIKKAVTNTSGEEEEKGAKEKEIKRPVKEIILELAKDDEELQDVIVGKIGALDHMATCLQYDFVWENAKKNQLDENKNAKGQKVIDV